MKIVLGLWWKETTELFGVSCLRLQSQYEAAVQWKEMFCVCSRSKQLTDSQVSADVIRFFSVKYNKWEIRQHASRPESNFSSLNFMFQIRLSSVGLVPLDLLILVQVRAHLFQVPSSVCGWSPLVTTSTSTYRRCSWCVGINKTPCWCQRDGQT